MPNRGHAELYLHYVWSTYRRAPLLDPDMEQPVYACIQGEAHRSGCEVIAIGGTADHVHVAVRMDPTVPAASLVKRMKSASSHLVRRTLRPGEGFRWQTGYGVFSFSRSHRDRVIGYLHRQKEHHAGGDVWGCGRRRSRARRDASFPAARRACVVPAHEFVRGTRRAGEYIQGTGGSGGRRWADGRHERVRGRCGRRGVRLAGVGSHD